MSAAQVPTPQPTLYRPVLLRALISLAFGLTAVFIPDLNPLWRAILTGVFFLASAVATLWLARFIRAARPGAGRVLNIESVILVLAGVAALFVGPGTGYQVLAVSALLVAGLLELVLGVRLRRGTVLGRDWLVTGVIWVCGAVALVAVGQAAYRAPLGVLGGVAVVTGVVLLLAALTYRHDAAAGPSAEAQVRPARQ